MKATPNDDAPWGDLPYSARMALMRVADLLSGGFTGRIELNCGQGGVRSLTHGRQETADDIEEAFRDGQEAA